MARGAKRQGFRPVYLFLLLPCIALLWVFWQGNSYLSVRAPAVLAMATVLGLLAAYELTIRDAPPGWVLGSVLVIQGLFGGARSTDRIQATCPSDSRP